MDSMKGESMGDYGRVRDGAGFSLLEALLAMIILGAGLLALAMGLAQGLSIVSASPYHQIAREKASETMESVFTARDARKISSWDKIRNRSQGGVFLDGPQPMRTQGADGLVNTLDDGELETHTLPGRDNIMGTADDVTAPLTGFTREIEITGLSPNLRRIRVIVRYTIRGLERQYQIVACISPFA